MQLQKQLPEIGNFKCVRMNLHKYWEQHSLLLINILVLTNQELAPIQFWP